MKKALKYFVIVVIVVSLLSVLNYFRKANSSSIIDYKTELPVYTSIKKEVIATGKLNPEDEIQLKPQVSGIIDKIYVEEGDLVNKGDLIANIRVVPNEQSLINAKSRINSAKLSYNNAKSIFDRNKKLFEKGVISQLEFENSQLAMEQSRETYKQAQNDYKIIKKGHQANSQWKRPGSSGASILLQRHGSQESGLLA